MLRFTILAVLFAAVCAVPVDLDSKTTVDVVVVENINQYLAENPEVEILEKLEREEYLEAENRQQIRYTIGQRVSGDRLVATASYANQWSTPQQVTSTVRYPASGVGSIVTFVGILVEQSTNQGQAYVISGGINQRQISFVIEARNTLFFRYNAEIYGYN